RDVPAGEIHAGNPAEFIKKRPLGPSTLKGPFRALRLTIVTGPFNALPPAPCGAMEMVWMGLAHELNRMGHRVTMLSRAYEGSPNQEDRDGIRILRRTQFKRSRFNKFDLIKDFLYGLRWLAEVPPSDVVVTNTLFLPAMMSISHRNRSKINVNMNRFPKRQAWIYLRTHRLAAASGAVADAVAAQTPLVKRKDLLRVMPNPIRTDVFTPPSEERNFTSPQKTIIYTGRINKEKGLHLLVGAFRILSKDYPELKLRLIGPSALEQGGGGKPYLDKLKKLAEGAAISIEDPIFDREELANALRSAHYYCYPSVAYYGEACPVAPIEAMATGLVPVVSDLPQFLEYLVPGENGLVFEREAPDAEAQLASHLKSLIEDPERAIRMGTRAAERAKEFSYRAIASKFLEDCAELLGIDPSEVFFGASEAEDDSITETQSMQPVHQQEAEAR
ncbi:MAG: glycosyltransferase, partial [Planctomycetota bacterium]